MAKFIFLHDCKDCAKYNDCTEAQDKISTDCKEFEWREDL